MWPLFAGAATAAAGEALGAAAGRFKADGTGVDLHALERGERGGRPAQLVGAVDRYRASLTVEGRGNHDKLTIGISRRASAVEGEETARRRPTQLMVQLPKRGVHQAYKLCFPLALVEVRADGTYGLKVGWHQFKSRPLNQLIDVHVTKIG